MTDRIHSHLQALVGERHPVTAAESLLRAEQYLTDQLRGLDWKVTTHAFPALGGTFRNIIADHPSFTSGTQHSSPSTQHSPIGTQSSAWPVIVAAHYDTVAGSPGADDNASGLAVLLEVAWRLRHEPVKRPVQLVAFCLEEEDLLGSLAYAAWLKEAGKQIRGALVLECVGYATEKPGTQKVPPGTPIEVPSVGDFLGVVGNEASSDLVRSFERSANSAVPDLKIVSLVVPAKGEMLPDTRRSDHAAFWEHGFPAVMLTDTADFRNPHYHQPTDTLGTLNLGFIEHVAQAVAAAATDMANDE